MPTDGTLIRPFLGEALAQDGLGRRAAASPHPRGGGISQGTAQPVAIAPKRFPDAPRFWPLPLPSMTNRERAVSSGSPGSEEAKMSETEAGVGIQGLREGEDSCFTFPGFLWVCPPATPDLGKGETDTYLVVIGFEFLRCKVLSEEMSD